MKRFLSIVLLAAMAVSLVGCAAREPQSTTISAVNLTCDLPTGTVGGVEDLTSAAGGVPGFTVRLFQASAEDGKNTLVSPLSVLYALAMTANGAKGETLNQMEAVLGMPVEALNTYLSSYRQALEGSDGGTLRLANSIWFTDHERFTVEQSFLQLVADYYGADVYRAPFDQSTCDDINLWVKQKTDGMIQDILDKIPDEAVMYLVNALAFEAEWLSVYDESQVRDGIFTLENGTQRDAELMYGEESLYLELENATGFIKYYKGMDYAFVALLPSEGTPVRDVVAALDGGQLVQLLENPQKATVLTAIPKFESEYSVEMSQVLKDMGMPNAFDSGLAELSGLGNSTEGNLFINRVLHKTFISVGEQGTRAGAATVVEVTDESAMIHVEDPKQVYLDRPFVYMLVDCQTNTPFFIGTLMDPQQ